MKCECGCGNDTHLMLIDRKTIYNVCHNCMIDLINLNLSKEQFAELIANDHTTDQFLLHDDFYDSKGRALQPRLVK